MTQSVCETAGKQLKMLDSVFVICVFFYGNFSTVILMTLSGGNEV